MTGIIKLSTPVAQYELPLIALNEEEINNKCQLLKNSAEIDNCVPFVIWLQLPSRMNNTEFKTT